MPVARSEGHRWRKGIWTVSDLTSAYALTAFPLQSDQGSVPWTAPVADILSVPEFGLISQVLSGEDSPQGFYRFTWSFDFWTFGMMSYVRTTFFDPFKRSASATVMTYDDTNTAVFLTCIAHRPKFNGSDKLAALAGGYENVTLQFDFGQVIT
jgi:hypothetical protein